ncbi:hypothetical protein [Nitratireductor basaltis]|uniref:Uncharacterized protein n=1 Tax=Nitratireductor basaltis TaxID=472175 RepID=A0A084U7K0_9HYPH|nr:hypothetical protein [Nitratireductor basaltis]KFB08936.1 hypothetical protein EL18_03192 [Nitratireductor basaltis]
MTTSDKTLNFATLEGHLMSVLAEVERGNLSRRQALRLIMQPTKQWLMGDEQGALEMMEAALHTWEDTVQHYRSQSD